MIFFQSTQLNMNQGATTPPMTSSSINVIQNSISKKDILDVEESPIQATPSPRPTSASNKEKRLLVKLLKATNLTSMIIPSKFTD